MYFTLEPYCRKRKFRTRKLLVAHRRRIHFRENLTLRCPLCNLPRSRQYDLNVHTKMHRDNNHTAEMFVFDCPHCSTKFMSEYSRHCHIKRLHPEVNNIAKEKNIARPAKKKQKITTVTDDKIGVRATKKTKAKKRWVKSRVKKPLIKYLGTLHNDDAQKSECSTFQQ